MKIEISQALLNSIGTKNVCNELSSTKVSQLFIYKSKNYIILSTESKGSYTYSKATAYEVVLSKYFTGKAVSYAQHGFDVMDGKAEKGYSNVSFEYKNQKFVILGTSIDFIPIDENKQLELF